MNRDQEVMIYQLYKAEAEIGYYADMFYEVDSFVPKEGYETDKKLIKEDLETDLKILNDYLYYLREKYTKNEPFLMPLNGEKKYVESNDKNYDKDYIDLSDYVDELISSCKKLLDEKFKEEIVEAKKAEEKATLEPDVDAIMNDIHGTIKIEDEIKDKINKDENSLDNLKNLYEEVMSYDSYDIENKSISEIKSKMYDVNTNILRLDKLSDDLISDYANKRSIKVLKIDDSITASLINSDSSDYLEKNVYQQDIYKKLLSKANDFYNKLNGKLQSINSGLSSEEKIDEKENKSNDDGISTERVDMPKVKMDLDRLFRVSKYNSKGALLGLIDYYGGYSNVWFEISREIRNGNIDQKRAYEFKMDYEKLLKIDKDKDSKFDTLTEDPIVHGEKIQEEKKVIRKMPSLKLLSSLKEKLNDNKKRVIAFLSSVGLISAVGASLPHGDPQIEGRKPDNQSIEESIKEEVSSKKQEISVQSDTTQNDAEVSNPKTVYVTANDALNGQNGVEPNDDYNFNTIALYDSETNQLIYLTEEQYNNIDYINNLNAEHGNRLVRLNGNDYGDTNQNLKNADGWTPINSEGGKHL